MTLIQNPINYGNFVKTARMASQGIEDRKVGSRPKAKHAPKQQS